MTRVFLADSQIATRSAFRLVVQDLNMQVVGEAADWFSAMTQASGTQPDMLVVNWDLIPTNSSLVELRATCPAAVVIVLLSQFDARRQAALSAGADSFISQGEPPERVAERLRAAVGSASRNSST
ncbi:putative two-component response regulator [Candidatus Promineifilum breve]|uniref:Two-component response regulator n=1 Tax=Candidatus Promineifilum breve TaxID=1806508 RepID=A0A160T500_9CHLR|nr:response regulator transcription factor [Candidatus Promineifilum breve]CUS04872.2 putative two-component response regulator [Candidatus Promineifilum breve]